MLIVGMVAMMVVSPGVHAAEKKDKAARRLQQMMQKMEQEKAELQAQFDQKKTELEGQLKQSQQETSSLKTSLGGAQHKNKMLEAELKSVQDEKSQLETKQQQTENVLHSTQMQVETVQKSLSDLTTQYQQAQRDIKVGETERKTLAANLAQKQKFLGVCEDKNTKLHAFGLELISVYDHPESLRGEPFTQLKRVQMENLLQDYRDKLDEQRVEARVN